MKWAKFLSGLSKMFIGMFVKNPNSQAAAEAIGQLADANIEAIDATLEDGKK